MSIHQDIMTRSRVPELLKRAGAGAIGLGTAVLGVAQGLGDSVGHYLPYLNAVGGSLTAAGLIAAAVGFSWITRSTRWDYYRARPMFPSELSGMQEVLKEFGGREITPVASKRDFLK